MPSINDWAAKAARRIDSEYPRTHSVMRDRPTVDKVAAIVATFAAPLVMLLEECGRGSHSHGYNKEERDHPPCPKSYDDPTLEECECNCGADAWNARVDAALRGEKKA